MTGYNIKVILNDFDPLTWRELAIPSGITFKQLHEIIQVAVNLDNYHSYSFTFPDDEEEILDFEGGNGPSSDKTLIDSYFDSNDVFYYEYDFGDSWLFIIEVEKANDYKENYATLLNFEGKYNLVEDCGGTYGLSELIYYKENPDEEIEEGFEEALGDLKRCNKKSINKSLKQLKK